MTDIEKLKKIVKKAKNIVFFGGAGVSTSSGIPDFRGTGGLYTDADGDDIPPELILSIDYAKNNTEKFYEYYKNNMIYPDAKPNGAHIALAKLEKAGKLSAVITQNIDGLHTEAGSKNVLELHGSVLKNYCVNCGKAHSLEYVMQSEGVPTCELCGAKVRPDVVLYGEGLDEDTMMEAGEAIYNADVLIVGGTSLTVNPAASFVRLYRGDHLIIINKTPTPYDCYAELIIRDPIDEVLSAIVCED